MSADTRTPSEKEMEMDGRLADFQKQINILDDKILEIEWENKRLERRVETLEYVTPT